MEEGNSLYSAVYEAIDGSIALGRCLPSADANVQRALVHFRGAGRDPETVRQLESISVQLHRLTAAGMAQQGACRSDTVRQLNILANEWMARLPMQ